MEMPRTQSVEFRVIRNVPEILNATFDFIREHYRPLSKLILQRAFPPLMLAYIFYANILSGGLMEIVNLYSYYGENVTLIPGSPILQILLMLVLFAVGYTFLFSAVYIYARHVVYAEGKEVLLEDVWEDMKGDFWRMFWTNVGVGVLWGIASFLLTVVTGVFSAVSPLIGSLVQLFGLLAIITTYSLYYPARFIDDEGFGSAFSRSSSLVSGSWWRTMGLVVLCGLLVLCLSIVMMVPLFIVSYLIRENIGDVGWMDNNLLIVRIIMTISIALFAGLVQICTIFPMFSLIFHYFNLIERREATVLREQIEEIGVANAEV